MVNIESNNQGILSVPPELHVQIKSYLSNKEYKNFDLTCYTISRYIPSKSELQYRNCINKYQKDYWGTYGHLGESSRWYSCGHLSCIRRFIIEYKLSMDDIFSSTKDFYKDRIFFLVFNNNLNNILRHSCVYGYLDVIKYLFGDNVIVGKEVCNIIEDTDCPLIIGNYLGTSLYFSIGNRFGYSRYGGHLDTVKYIFEHVKRGIQSGTINIGKYREDYNNFDIYYYLVKITKDGSLEVLKYIVEECKKSDFLKDDLMITLNETYLLENGINYNNLDIIKYLLEQGDYNIDYIKRLCRENSKRSLRRNVITEEMKECFRSYIDKKNGLTKCNGYTKGGKECTYKARNSKFCKFHTSQEKQYIQNDREKLPTSVTNCGGITKKGLPCKNKVRNGTMCWLHK